MSLMMPLVLLFLPASTKNDKFHSPPELSEVTSRNLFQYHTDVQSLA